MGERTSKTDGAPPTGALISNRPTSHPVKTMWFVVKLGLGIVLIFWLLKTGRFQPSVYQEMLHGDRSTVLLIVLSTQCSMLLATLIRWWLLVTAQGIPVSLVESLRLGMMGAFTNLFVPGGMGIDGVRILYLRRHFPERWLEGTASVVMDRSLGLLALLLLGSVSSLFLLSMSTSLSVGRLAFVNVLLILGIVMLLTLACRYLKRGLPEILRQFHWVEKLLEAMRIYRVHYGAVIGALCLSFVGHAGVMLATYFSLVALGFPSSVLGIVTVTPLVVLCRAIPIVPLGLGVSDSAAAFLFPLVGLQGGAEVQMLLRTTLSLLLILCGLAFLIHGRRLQPIHVEQNHSAQAFFDPS